MEKETEITLREAAYEIRQLRRQNEILGAKVSTMEMLDRFLHAEYWHPSVGVSEDVAWKIDRMLDKINKD